MKTNRKIIAGMMLAIAIPAMADASGKRFGSDTMDGIGKGATP